MQSKKTRRMLLLIPAVALVVLAGGYILLCALANTERMLPRTTVNKVDLSGMTREEAMAALKADVKESRSAANFTVAFEGKSYTVAAGDALKYDYKSAVQKVFQKSQSPFSLRGLSLLRAVLLGNHSQYAPAIKDAKALEEAILASGLLEAGHTVQTSYKTEGGQLIFTIGTAGEDVDADALLEKITQAVQANDYENVISCPDTVGEVKPVDLDQVYQEVHIDPANATLDPERDYAIVEAVTGVSFDKEAAQAALDLAEEGSAVAVDLIYTEPEISAQDLEEHLFTDVLSTFTTQVGGSSNRRTNITLATEKCNGSILTSGSVFSFNNTVGEQTEETGFKLDNAILDGQIVQAYGGGICQVSSTIFAAALYANLEIVERWNHDFVSSYIPAGVDAAVAWDGLDLQIANNHSYPIRIDVRFSDGNLTVDIIGTKTAETPVEIETKTVPSTTPGTLAMETYRKVFNGDKSQFFIEKIADSEYLN